MRSIVLRYGLKAGVVLAAFTAVLMPICLNTGLLDTAGAGSMAFGYAAMLLAFLFVYFGVRRYRDEEGGGAIGFGRAFGVGLLIVTIASALYVLGWEVVYWGGFVPGFLDAYQAKQIAAMEAAGQSAEAIAAARVEMARFAELYASPLWNSLLTLLEVFPVGFVVALVSAGILRRPAPPVAPARAVPTGA